MDDIVKAALKKWPNVPHCRGWLALDSRGDWYMRDDRIQAAGPFPQVKGSRIQHDKLRDFIHRNYAADEASGGAWFFQNGPQRVYVELEAAPWVWRLDRDTGGSQSPSRVLITSHTGQAAQFESACTDERGRLFVVTDLGLGLVHTLDMALAAEQVDQGHWQIDEVHFDELPQRHRYRLSPAADVAAAAPEKSPDQLP